MNEVNLQKEVLATILKKKAHSIMYYKDLKNNIIWIGFDGLRLYAMDLFKFYIDLDAAECRDFQGIKSILEGAYKAECLEYTNELKQCDKKTCIKLHCDSFETWINKDFLKYYKNIEDLQFRSVGRAGVVFVYEYETLSAIICPVMVKE